MAKFRKKPVEIEAWLSAQICEAAANNWNNLPQSIRDAYDKGGWVFIPNGSIHIPTLEGTMKSNPDDYIIKGVNGEFYPCKPDIFEKTYEEATESDFLTRLIDERDQLSERIEKLKEFIRSGKVYEIDEVQQVLLYAQLPAMRTYLTILNQRIDRL